MLYTPIHHASQIEIGQISQSTAPLHAACRPNSHGGRLKPNEVAMARRFCQVCDQASLVRQNMNQAVHASCHDESH
jgi:hypothetical protein